MNNLSPREKQVLDLLLQGKSNKQIALALNISERTVQFHLTNIYAKFEVSSRIELILKLGQPTGHIDANLWESTVANKGEKAENRDRSALRMGRVASFKGAVSTVGKELEMKNALKSTHVLAGIGAAVLTGLLWIVVLYRMGTSRDEFMPSVVPALFICALLGLILGLLGKRLGSSPLKVAFSAMVGTGASPLTVLPLLGLVVLPLGKIAEGLGLVNRAALSDQAIMSIVITSMLLIWLVVGTLMGSGLLFISIYKPGQKVAQVSVGQHP